MSRLTAIAALRVKDKLSFDDAMFVTAYAQAYGHAPWGPVSIRYCRGTLTYSITR